LCERVADDAEDGTPVLPRNGCLSENADLRQRTRSLPRTTTACNWRACESRLDIRGASHEMTFHFRIEAKAGEVLASTWFRDSLRPVEDENRAYSG